MNEFEKVYSNIILEYRIDPICIYENIVSRTYKNGNKVLKMSVKNPATKGLLHEFNTLNEIKHLGISPIPISYKKILDDRYEFIEVLTYQYIDGKTLTKSIWSTDIKRKIYETIKILYDNNFCHGDIKEDNILIQNDKIFLIDFDQAKHLYFNEFNKPCFGFSSDIEGNIYSQDFKMNFNELCKRMEQ